MKIRQNTFFIVALYCVVILTIVSCVNRTPRDFGTSISLPADTAQSEYGAPNAYSPIARLDKEIPRAINDYVKTEICLDGKVVPEGDYWNVECTQNDKKGSIKVIATGSFIQGGSDEILIGESWLFDRYHYEGYMQGYILRQIGARYRVVARRLEGRDNYTMIGSFLKDDGTEIGLVCSEYSTQGISISECKPYDFIYDSVVPSAIFHLYDDRGRATDAGQTYEYCEILEVFQTRDKQGISICIKCESGRLLNYNGDLVEKAETTVNHIIKLFYIGKKVVCDKPMPDALRPRDEGEY